MDEEEKGQKAILQKKKSTSLEQLCQGLPLCFYQFMKYVRKLAFEQKPDYKYLKNLFEDYIAEQKYEYGPKFDWHLQKEKILEQKMKKEEEEKQMVVVKKQGKNKLPNKREQQQQEAQAKFEKLEEEKKRKLEEKKRKKLEKKEEEKIQKSSEDFAEL